MSVGPLDVLAETNHRQTVNRSIPDPASRRQTATTRYRTHHPQKPFALRCSALNRIAYGRRNNEISVETYQHDLARRTIS
ncbi:unnamed protein product [Macrosiphum euphorbiae]|uniref:Uncharacterized protein n=1 Tax=Macrosiphum euphorbiae TaxID=13131 RepID=A0AAV0XEQ3_9HEMI|nr:unnamed protein product [Macrosiphum euphorbiae]